MFGQLILTVKWLLFIRTKREKIMGWVEESSTDKLLF